MLLTCRLYLIVYTTKTHILKLYFLLVLVECEGYVSFHQHNYEITYASLRTTPDGAQFPIESTSASHCAGSLAKATAATDTFFCTGGPIY